MKSKRGKGTERSLSFLLPRVAMCCDECLGLGIQFRHRALTTKGGCDSKKELHSSKPLLLIISLLWDCFKKMPGNDHAGIDRDGWTLEVCDPTSVSELNGGTCHLIYSSENWSKCGAFLLTNAHLDSSRLSTDADGNVGTWGWADSLSALELRRSAAVSTGDVSVIQDLVTWPLGAVAVGSKSNGRIFQDGFVIHQLDWKSLMSSFWSNYFRRFFFQKIHFPHNNLIRVERDNEPSSFKGEL